MTTTESLIVRVIQAYYPSWVPPRETGREWLSCLCPFHGDSRPSATVSYDNDAFRCFACDVKGDAFRIIMREEKCNYKQAVTIAEGILPGSRAKLQGNSPAKPRRRVFGESGGQPSGGSEVRNGIRSRPSPWT